MRLSDTYRINSIKGNERQASGVGARYVLNNSPDMKVPYDFPNFLRKGDNKAMLFDLIQQSIEEDKDSIGDKLVYFSNKSVCKNINHDYVATLTGLTSDHEEADTKLVAFVRASQLIYFHLYRSIFILGYGGQSKRGIGSGFRMVRLFFI
jgi:hypothetical protein